MKFDKYENIGAYHWNECNKYAPGNIYNPALEARYSVVVNKVVRKEKALEVGCGDGYLINLVSNYFDEVHGVDDEESAIKLARIMLANNRNCIVNKGSCYELKYHDESFDTVFMADVIEHLTYPEMALTEIARVLKPDGTLFVTTPKSRLSRISDVFHIKE